MFSVMLVMFAILLGADVMIKRWVEDELNQGEERKLPGGGLVLRKVYNRGFLLNLFDERPKAVRGMSVFAGAGVLAWDFLTFAKKRSYVKKLGMALVSAGAASNLFDRLAKGKVVDYIGFKTKKKFLGRITANLGDIYLVCGGVLVMAGEMLSVVLHRDKTKK
jgi:Lipoprotein signal peptidase